MAEINLLEPPSAIVPPVAYVPGRNGALPVVPPDWLVDADRLPTQDELPYDDGIPMDTPRHGIQMNLMTDSLIRHWKDRDDYFVGGNMFVYFSPQQVKTHDYRGPDVLVVLDVDGTRERKSWVVWEEGKPPDVVIELLSDSTAEFDKDEKKKIYQDRLRVPEYFWFDPFRGDWAGFALRAGRYRRIKPDKHGRLISERLGLALVRWEGSYQRLNGWWLRWETLDGKLLPTGDECAEQADARAAQERERAEQERERAEQERARAEQADAQAAQERARAEQERKHAAQERERAEQADARAQRLAAKLRAAGIEPD